jgi:hypothetical protein
MLSTHCRRLRFEPLEDRRLLTTITVNTLVDENDGIGVGGVSLREAVAAAAPGGTVNFSVTGTISLTSADTGHIAISKNLTIQGPGSNLLTVKAFDPDPGGTNNSNGRRVFVVDDGAGTLANVMISGLTLTNADPVVLNENDGGSAILNRENLTLNACVLSGNYSPNGGSIYSTGGSLTINDSTITGNSAGDGGAVLIQSGSLAVNRSKILNNAATNSGGGVIARGVPITIADSTLSGNSSDENGGAIYLYQGSLSMSGTTISGNAADNNSDGVGSGGGIYNLGGSLSIVNSTISGGNTAREGGGIFSSALQAIRIAHSTITGNRVPIIAGVYGGGINSAGPVTLDHTIVAGNFRGASTPDDVKGSFDATYSLIGDRRDAMVNNMGGSLIGTTALPIDAKLGTLANNGGPTSTHALLSGSPAIEAGAVAVAGAGGVPLYDQRGTPFSRVVDYDNGGGARIDIGAVEMPQAPTVPTLLGDYNLNHAVDAGDYVLWRKTSGSGVSPAYAGADGDGNSVVNANDYTVWRSRFGNVGSAATGTATNGELGIAQPTSGSDENRDDVAGMVITASVSASTVLSTPRQREVGESSVAAIDLALGLLIVSDGTSVGINRERSDFSVVNDDSITVDNKLFGASGDSLLSDWGSVDLTLLALRASN